METTWKKRRTEVTIETQRVFVIRTPKDSTRVWCAVCAALLKAVTPAEAAVLACVSTRTIYRWVEAGKLHFTETPDGTLWICFNSLLSET